MARKTAATPAKKATKKTATKKTARKSAPQAEAAPKRTSRRHEPEVVEEQVEHTFNTYEVDQIAEQAFEAGVEVGEQQTHQHFADRTLEINGLSGRQASLLAQTVLAAHDVEKYEQLLKNAHAELRRRSLVAVSEVPAGRYVIRGELIDVTSTTVVRQQLGQIPQGESVELDRVGRISGLDLAIPPTAARYR